MRIEIYSFFLYFSKRRKGEYLKSAAVGKYRFIPDHKFMETSEFFDNFITGSEMQMIGV